MASDDGALGNCLSDIETAALEVIRDNDGVALKYRLRMQVKSKLNVSAIGVSMAPEAILRALSSRHGGYIQFADATSIHTP